MSVLQYDPIAAQENEQPVLRKIERALEKSKPRGGDSQDVADLLPKLVSPYGDEIDLPPSLFQLLKLIAYELGLGKAIGVVSVPQELSILEAATLLDVSTSYLISLLDSGKVPFVQVGMDQRILFSDIMAYKKHQDEEMLEALAEVAQMCQDEGAYD